MVRAPEEGFDRIMDGQSAFTLLGFVAACLAAASSGALFRAGPWYEGIEKPSWRPPNWLFGPVWAVLYAMIAVSGWLVWSEAGWAAALPLGIYAVQLLLNALWSAIFFGMRRPGLALAEMGALWLSVVATIFAFHPLHAGAAYLLVPYLFWVSFAFVLNLAICRLNRRPLDPAAPLRRPG